MDTSFYLTVKWPKLIFMLLFSCITINISSQDIGILSSSSPNSGCELSNNELVTVVIFNYGSNYTGSFDVSYEINSGVPITETITLSPFLSTSSFAYTFTVPADLSTANSYSFDFYTNLVGDINNANDTLSNITVVSDTLSTGGVLSTSQSVCFGNNSGTLNLSGSIGSVQFWESSINAGSSWSNIANTTSSENYLNLIQETWYRAVVLNGFCPQDTSSVAVLSIDSLTVPGNIAGATTLCSPPNGGSLTLSGETGTIIDWEFSANAGIIWNSIGSTNNPYNYTNQPSTYLYRALVQSGACSLELSDTVQVAVLTGAVGGILSPANQAECSGSNSGSISLSGHSGTISGWETSINSGVTWSSIVNTTNIQSYLNLTQETWYRALLSDCNQDTSSVTIITIDPNPIGGSLSSNAIVCVNSNSGTITLAGEIGTIIDWEFSINGGSSWSSLSNTTNSYNYNNITITTLYRGIVGSGVCAQVFSDTVTITVVSGPDAGTITGPTNVCAGINGGSLITTGVQGSIIDWEFSINSGISWASLGNTSTTNNFTNITQTTLYQIIVASGACPNDTSQFLITVDNPSVSGTLFSDATVCYLSSGFIYVNGHQGSIFGWESSANGGLSWSPLGFFIDTIGYTNIANQTLYRTLIKSGACPIDTTNNISIDIFPYNIGTSNDTTIELGNSATISAFGGLFYSWSPSGSLGTPNDSTTIAIPLVTTNYVASIIDGNGCVYQDNVIVTVIVSTSDVTIADLITANGDGFNDTWNIMGVESHPDTKVLVFNTSGNTVFESSDYDNSWKGTYNGSQLPDGTYYYIVELTAESDVRKGFITIVSE
jgi:gliding motility-associated-like protein